MDNDAFQPPGDFGALDKEMERIVAEAEQAAETVRANLAAAQQTKEHLLAKAQQEADQLRAEASAIVAGAEAEAERIRTTARAEGDSVVNATQDKARDMLADAERQIGVLTDEAVDVRAMLAEKLPLLQDLLDRLEPALDTLRENGSVTKASVNADAGALKVETPTRGLTVVPPTTAEAAAASDAASESAEADAATPAAADRDDTFDAFDAVEAVDDAEPEPAGGESVSGESADWYAAETQ